MFSNFPFVVHICFAFSSFFFFNDAATTEIYTLSLHDALPIRGPGVCGADFPLKVSILGESAPLGYMDDLRPPGDIPRAAPRWPLRPAGPPAEPSYQSRVLPDDQVRSPQGRQGAPDQPISLSPPGVTEGPNVAAEPYDFR